MPALKTGKGPRARKAGSLPELERRANGLSLRPPGGTAALLTPDRSPVRLGHSHSLQNDKEINVWQSLLQQPQETHPDLGPGQRGSVNKYLHIWSGHGIGRRGRGWGNVENLIENAEIALDRLLIEIL